uniref:DZF domain-containing protein n=1 Tax=Eptatretus burgeri TaxID=7764 RepID=A0A8C4QJS4_EPTBU
MKAAPSSTKDDRHVMAKHSAIYPQAEELKAVQSFINTTELALTMLADGKLYSNRFPSESDSNAEDSSSWESCGIVRTGAVAKGLLLRGDRYFDLVIICKDKPTRWNVAAQGKEQFTVTANPNDATIKVMARRSNLWINITLTSPAMREHVENKADVLDRQKCLKALTAVRHTKWFQGRRFIQKSFIIVLRVMRDLCNRVHTWKPLQGWVIELLCEKAIMTCIRPIGTAEALRRVFECLAAGMLHKDKPGILDPCEKEPKDVLDGITAQQKEDITKSAQVPHTLILLLQLLQLSSSTHPSTFATSMSFSFTVSNASLPTVQSSKNISVDSLSTTAAPISVATARSTKLVTTFHLGITSIQFIQTVNSFNSNSNSEFIQFIQTNSNSFITSIKQ